MIIDGALDAHGTLIVKINGKKLSPKASQRVWNHSPTGFAVGYHGSGPAQLALAILLKAKVGTTAKEMEANAVALHQAFKRDVIATLHAPFHIELNVAAWAQPLLKHHDGDTLVP